MATSWHITGEWFVRQGVWHPCGVVVIATTPAEATDRFWDVYFSLSTEHRPWRDVWVTDSNGNRVAPVPFAGDIQA